MSSRKGRHKFLSLLLVSAMACTGPSAAFPVMAYGESYVQETPNMAEIAEPLETQDIQLSPYVSGQGTGNNGNSVMEIVMLNPAPSGIQTQGLVTAQEAGLDGTIAPADENVYYNVITDELDPAGELTFRILASGKGLNNHFSESCFENMLTVYDSDKNIVNTDEVTSIGTYDDTEISGITINGNSKKAMLFTYPKGVFKGNSTYYLVVSENLKSDNGNAVLGTKVVFCFNTKESSEPAETYYNVQTSGTGAADVQGNKTVPAGSDYTFTVAGNPYYIDYTVTASIDGKEAVLEKDETGKIYTIRNVSGNVEIAIDKRIKSAQESPLKYNDYKAGQGSRAIQIYMLNPASADIQTAGLVPAETAGAGSIAAEPFEEVYYNRILSEFDPKQEITFKVLAAGSGVGNGLHSDSIYNVASIYDSHMNVLSVNASYPGTFPTEESCDAEFTVDNNEARHKRATSVTYPAGTFQHDSVYYLVIHESFHVNNGAPLGNKAIFCFKTAAAPDQNEPEKPQKPQKGSVLTDNAGRAKYKVTKAGKNVNGTVTGAEAAYMKPVLHTASITVPDTITIKGVKYKVTSIAAQAFKNNKVVTKVKIGSNVTVIGKNAFRGCGKLQSATIGKNVTTIKTKAFYGCKKLKRITINTAKLTSKEVGSKAFAGISKNCIVKVPKKKLAGYKKFLYKKGMPKKVKIK